MVAAGSESPASGAHPGGTPPAPPVNSSLIVMADANGPAKRQAAPSANAVKLENRELEGRRLGVAGGLGRCGLGRGGMECGVGFIDGRGLPDRPATQAAEVSRRRGICPEFPPALRG